MSRAVRRANLLGIAPVVAISFAAQVNAQPSNQAGDTALPQSGPQTAAPTRPGVTNGGSGNPAGSEGIPTTSGAAAVDEGGGLSEIVVTAEKRSSNLQRTPIAITALNGAALAQAQVRTLQDIQALVPNLKVTSTGGYAQVTIRGIGITNFTPGAESAVAVNLNGVFISRPVAQLTSLYDVSTLEVLRGPQGTLYGRNATAGSINITTNLPTESWSGYARATVGNYDAFRGEVAVGGPLIDDRLGVRIAAFGERHHGYGENLATGNDIDDKRAYGVRGTLVASPTENLKATLIAEYFHERDNSAAVHYAGAAGLSGLPGAIGVPPLFVQLGGYAASSLYDVANGEDPRFRLRTLALTGTLDWQLGDLAFRSITGYRRQRSLAFTPIDGGAPLNSFYLSGEPAHQFSEELQVRYDAGRLHLTGGLFYFRERDSASPSVASLSSTAISAGFGVPAANPPYFVDFVEIGGTIHTNAKAVFGQATYDVTDSLSLTAGIRYSHERKTFDQRFSFSLFTPLVGDGTAPAAVRQPPRTFTATTPKFGIQYQLSSKTLVYASYSKGFKSGSFDIGFFPSLGFKPERLTDYEGGIKTTLLDNRLRINVSGFYYDYKDLQVPQVVNFSVTTTNAATARDYGAEAELTFLPTPDLELNAAVTYLHARYRGYTGADAARPLLSSVDFGGNRLNNAPDFTAHLSGQYTYQLASGSLIGRVEGDYTSRVYFSAANLILEGQRGFAKANAFLTYDSGRSWSLTGFVRNISNKAVKLSAVVQSPQLGNPVNSAIAAPRTFGAELGVKF